MSSNPFHSARESLLSLFEENRKKVIQNSAIAAQLVSAPLPAMEGAGLAKNTF